MLKPNYVIYIMVYQKELDYRFFFKISMLIFVFFILVMSKMYLLLYTQKSYF